MPKRLTSDDITVEFPRDPQYLQMMYNRLRHLEQAIQRGELIKAEPTEVKEKIPYQQIIDTYNLRCPSLAKCLKVTDSRRKSIKARWNEGNRFEEFEEVFIKAEASDFLTGRVPSKSRPNYKTNFDNLMQPKMFQKTLEGGHDNATKKQSSFNLDAYEGMAVNIKNDRPI